MTEPCGRADQVDLMSYVDDPGSPEWQGFRRHERECPTCRTVVEGWAVLAARLQQFGRGSAPPHPDESHLVDYHRRPDLLSAAARASIDQHVQTCSVCRADLAFTDSFVFTLPKLRQVEAEQEGDEVAAAKPPWREPVAKPESVAKKERVYELTSPLVIELRKLAAVFTEVPTGLVPTPYGTSTPAMRGAAMEATGTSIEAPGQRVKVPLGDSGIGVELAVERQPADRLRIRVRLEGGGPIRMAVSLRQRVGSQLRIVAAQSTEEIEPFVIEKLATGTYLLEVWGIERRHRFQMSLQVVPSTSQ